MSDHTTTNTPGPEAGETRPPPPTPPPDGETGTTDKHSRIPTIRGWFKVHRLDRARILTHCEGTALAALSVWDALCDLSNQARSDTFVATIGVIRTRAGTGRSTTFRALALLEELHMLERIQNRKKGHKSKLEASTYTLLTQSIKGTTPPSNSRTRGSPSKFSKSGTEVLRTPQRGVERKNQELSSFIRASDGRVPPDDPEWGQK